MFGKIANRLENLFGGNFAIEQDTEVRVRNNDYVLETKTYSNFFAVSTSNRLWLLSVGKTDEYQDGVNLIAVPVESLEPTDVSAALNKLQNSADVSDLVVFYLNAPDIIILNTEGDYGKEEDLDVFITSEHNVFYYESLDDISEQAPPPFRRYWPKAPDFYAKYCMKLLKRSNRRRK